jgi:UMF1 family MFS transporter
MSHRERAPVSVIFGWSLFDFANSSYTTVIVTVVFAQLFPKLIVGDERMGNLWWSVALSASYLLTVLTAPALGVLVDQTGRKKQFLAISWIFTVITTASLYFLHRGDVALGVLLIILSNYGFSAGESFCSAFLPELGPAEDLGRISGFAWGLGYFGGLASTAAVVFGLGPTTAENWSNLVYVGPVTAAFFFFGALPTFALLKDRGVPRPGQVGVGQAFLQVFDTIRSVRNYTDLAVFFASMFFSQAGLSIVVAFAFIYGDQVLHWAPTTMIGMFVITQITAAGGAVAFGVIQDRLGARPTYMATLVLWVVTSLLIYGTPMVATALASALGRPVSQEAVFLVVGGLAGSGLGATQSAGRALVGMFAPQDQIGELFGFWGLVGKLAAVFGLLGTGVLQAVLGLQTAILFCVVLFGAGLVIVGFVDEGRGRARARAPIAG